jgi:hypothetical protein
LAKSVLGQGIIQHLRRPITIGLSILTALPLAAFGATMAFMDDGVPVFGGLLICLAAAFVNLYRYLFNRPKK